MALHFDPSNLCPGLKLEHLWYSGSRMPVMDVKKV